MLRGAGHPFENFMTCVPDCYDPKLPWSFRAKNFQIFEMGFDNENQNMDELEAHLNRLDEVLRRLIVLLFILYKTELSFSGHGCGAYYRALR